MCLQYILFITLTYNSFPLFTLAFPKILSGIY